MVFGWSCVNRIKLGPERSPNGTIEPANQCLSDRHEFKLLKTLTVSRRGKVAPSTLLMARGDSLQNNPGKTTHESLIHGLEQDLAQPFLPVREKVRLAEERQPIKSQGSRRVVAEH